MLATASHDKTVKLWELTLVFTEGGAVKASLYAPNPSGNALTQACVAPGGSGGLGCDVSWT